MKKNNSKIPKITEEFKQQQQQAVLDAEVIYEFEQLLERKYPFIDVIPFVILILAATWGSFMSLKLHGSACQHF